MDTFSGKRLNAKKPFKHDDDFHYEYRKYSGKKLQYFDPERNEAVVFDEISGADFVIRNKKLLQGHVDGARLGQSPTQRFAYEVMLWRVPIVLTCNHWDPTADGLRPADQDWLLENCVVEAVNAPVWQ